MAWNVATNFPTVVAEMGPHAVGAAVGSTQVEVEANARVADACMFGGYAEIDRRYPLDQLDEHTMLKKAALVWRLGWQIVNGDGVAPNLAGFAKQIAVAQVRALGTPGTAGVPTLDDWRLLRSLVTASDGFVGTGADAFVCTALTQRHLLKLIAAAGAQPDWRADPVLGPVLHFDGLPVYIGQVSTQETDDGAPTYNTTSIWALKLRGPSGVRVYHVGGEPAEFGVMVRDAGQTEPTKGTVARFVGGFYALQVPEDQSLARLRRVSTSASTLGLPA